jgi:ABC-type Fe3+ transport system substrate-binding protein
MVNPFRRFRGTRIAAGTIGLAAAFLAQASAAAEWDAGAGKDWETLLAAARKEGQVVVSVCPSLIDPIGKMFREDTGIDINFVTGTIPEVNAKFDTEVKSGRVATDVRLGGPSAIVYAKQGLLGAVSKQLILPGVANPAMWYGGKISYTDATDTYLPIPAEYVGGRPVINADLIDAKSITRWDDLLKPEYKGKIAAMDPTDGGIGATAGEYIAKAKGIDFLTRLYRDQGATLVTDRRQLVEWAARGTYPIVIGADAAPEIETFRQAGISSLQILSLADGPGNLNGGCSVVAMPSKAPHPNAALVFVNWFMSKRGQEAYVAGQRQPSNRLDVAATGVQQVLRPEPGREYFSAYREGFVLEERPLLDAAIAKAMGK